MEEKLKQELEAIIGSLIAWTIKSGQDTTIGTVTRSDYIAGLTLTESDNYHIYKSVERMCSSEKK